MNKLHPTDIQQQLVNVNIAAERGDESTIDQMLSSLSDGDIARLLILSPPKMRQVTWKFVDNNRRSSLLSLLNDEVQADLLEDLEASEVAEITADMEADDVADILQQLPDRLSDEVLQSMDTARRQRAQAMLDYSEDTAGGLMNTDIITVRKPLSVEVVQRYLRLLGDTLPVNTDHLIVVDRTQEFIGVLPITKILSSPLTTTVENLMDVQTPSIPATLPAKEVAQLFEVNNLISAPVVNEDNILLGRITIDDVVDVIREDAEHPFLGLVGMSGDEDVFSSVRKAAPKRLFWLGINLLTAFVAVAAIQLFEAALERFVVLAILMPVVASMGGIAGSQTITIVIRGIAQGNVGHGNISWLVGREILMGLINGFFWALVIASIVMVWYSDLTLAIIIAAAMMLGLVIAACVGVLLPIALEKVKIDPALAGGVLLTTVTDVAGFMSFLGLATLFYSP